MVNQRVRLQHAASCTACAESANSLAVLEARSAKGEV